MLGKVAPQQQRTQFTCGAVCLKAVLEDLGFSGPGEADYARLIGITRDGAWPSQLVRAARRLGFDAHEARFGSLDEAKALTDRGIPVIANILSFTVPGGGHFVVITSINDEVQIMDPNVPGNRRTLSRQEMKARWRGRGNVGVVVRPRGSRTIADAESTPAGRPLALVAVMLGVGAAVVYAAAEKRRRRRHPRRAR